MYELSLTSRMEVDELAMFKALRSDLPKLDLLLYCQESDQAGSLKPSNTIISVTYSMHKNDLS